MQDNYRSDAPTRRSDSASLAYAACVASPRFMRLGTIAGRKKVLTTKSPIGRCRIVVGVLLLAVFGLSSAAEWVGPITPVQIRSSGPYSVVTFGSAEPIVNPANCLADFYAITLANQAQSALAILLTTYVAGLKVSVVVSTSGCDPTTGRVSVTDVMTSP